MCRSTPLAISPRTPTPTATPPPGVLVFVGKGGRAKRFHTTDACASRNAQETCSMTKEKADSLGLKPCLVCKPLPPDPNTTPVVAVPSAPVTPAVDDGPFYTTPKGKCYHKSRDCGAGLARATKAVTEHDSKPTDRHPCGHCCK